MSTARILTLLAVALLLAACGSQQSAIQTAIAQTSQAEGAMQTAVAQTLTALLTQTAAAQPPATTATETPTAAPADTSTPSEFAPDPLPASHTGVVLNIGECFDFDSGQVLTSAAAGCDMWQPEPALVRQMNGASISGYVTFEVPSKSRCVAATYDPNDLAIQTDLYMCLMTNEGAVGFLVARSYLGGVPMTGFAFDYWLFP